MTVQWMNKRDILNQISGDGLRKSRRMPRLLVGDSPIQAISLLNLTNVISVLKLMGGGYAAIFRAPKVDSVEGNVNEEGDPAGDVNGDGRAGLEETIYILQKLSGLRQ